MFKATQISMTEVILQNLKDTVSLQNSLVKFTNRKITLTTVQNHLQLLFLHSTHKIKDDTHPPPPPQENI